MSLPLLNEPLFETTGIKLDEAIENEHYNRVRRGHLGFSQIGEEDERTTWLKFRWSLPEDHDARVLRIFDLGNAIEDEVVRLLRKVNGLTVLDVDPETGEQFQYSELGGHFGGSQDGAVLGVPEAPKTWHLLEVKSAKESKFKELLKSKSVKEWNLTYWTQAQCYMGASGLTRTLFVVYNKNTSEIYFERIKLDKMTYPAMIARARRLIQAEAPPESSFPKREFYKARFMSPKQQSIYWGDQLPSPNCRNCRFVQPDIEGTGAKWFCTKCKHYMTVELQHKGCELHNWLPSLMPAEPVAVFDDAIQYRTHDGAHFWNAPEDEGAIGDIVYSSKELASLSILGLNKETFIDEALEIRTRFDARVEVES